MSNAFRATPSMYERLYSPMSNTNQSVRRRIKKMGAGQSLRSCAAPRRLRPGFGGKQKWKCCTRTDRQSQPWPAGTSSRCSPSSRKTTSRGWETPWPNTSRAKSPAGANARWTTTAAAGRPWSASESRKVRDDGGGRTWLSQVRHSGLSLSPSAVKRLQISRPPCRSSQKCVPVRLVSGLFIVPDQRRVLAKESHQIVTDKVALKITVRPLTVGQVSVHTYRPRRATTKTHFCRQAQRLGLLSLYPPSFSVGTTSGVSVSRNHTLGLSTEGLALALTGFSWNCAQLFRSRRKICLSLS